MKKTRIIDFILKTLKPIPVQINKSKRGDGELKKWNKDIVKLFFTGLNSIDFGDRNISKCLSKFKYAVIPYSEEPYAKCIAEKLYLQ